MATRIASLYAEIGADTSKLDKGLKDSKSNLKLAGNEMANIVKTAGFLAAGAAAAGVAMKAAFDLGREGAQITQTADSFDLLLQKVGAAPGLLDELRKASLGTVDDLTLMSSTATLLAGSSGDLATNLANATPQLLEIAKAAQKLNPSLGDTTFLYNSIATGVKRASPLILDNLGLMIKVGDANEKFAKAAGKAVSELTGEEQKQALLNATLAAGKVLIDQVGGSVDSATDSYDRFSVGVKGATDRLKEQANVGLEPTISKLADFLEVGNKQTDLLARMNTAFKEGNISRAEYTRLTVLQSKGTKSLDDAILQFNKDLVVSSGVMDNSYRSAAQLNAINGDLEMSARGYTGAIREANIVNSDAVMYTNLQKQAVEGLANGLDIAAQSGRNFGGGFEEVGRQSQFAARAIRKIGEGADASTSALERLNGIDLSIGSKIRDEIDKIKFDQLGGTAIEEMQTEINRQLNAGIIDESTAQAALGELLKVADTVQGSIDGIKTSEIAKQYSGRYGRQLQRR